MDTETDPRSCPFGSPQKDAAAIIGIGASAGGSAALETLFENCPTESGAAFVVIQDIPTKHDSLTAGLLAQRTRMPVPKSSIETDTRIRPDHVYLNPPGTVMRIEKGVLRLTPCDEGRSLPIDSFFTSLAEECGDRASGILLSGTGSDGTRGASAINAAGGLVLIQPPGDARFDGTPMSLRRAGIVDAELPVSELARRALAHRQRSPQPPFGSVPVADGARPDGKKEALPEAIKAILQGDRGFCLKWDDIMRRLPSRPQKTVGRVTSGRLRPGLPANHSSWNSRPSPVSLPPAGPTHLRPVPTGST
ncbi:hypothetical protein CCR90_02230 [Rhodovulum sulfidophilum]|uniref:chemotaxis protein CheB n=1 Tax=Rhodovulum sulfidophilum TaxID=35806 RepID=UPI001911363E|nr:chemotaxis protein CheB [Rhodovulum sulfidophilum]MBK5922612.1 hypothetical protein [Rhodovulum sulfidophilum]